VRPLQRLFDVVKRILMPSVSAWIGGSETVAAVVENAIDDGSPLPNCYNRTLQARII
jgi:hypothetical protein